MKKFYSFLVAAVVLMVATSCQKEAVENGFVGENAEFTASIASGRTELGDGNKVMWNSDDNIRIYTQENAAGNKFSSDATAATATATFTTTENFAASENGYLAVYPDTANTGNATCENGVWSVPVTISGWDGNPVNYPFAFEKNAFMAAFSNDNQLSFKAATAILKIKNIDNSWGGEIRFSGDILGGAATLHYDPNNAENPISYTLGSGDSSVLYNFPEQNGETIYVPIYPGTVTGFEVYGDDWQTPLVTYNKEITFKAGVIYDLDLDNAGGNGGNEDTTSPWMLVDPMYTVMPIEMTIDENGYHVAKNVPFCDNGYIIATDMMQSNAKRPATEMTTLGQWSAFSQNDSNTIQYEADYVDIYMNEDATIYCVVPAGASCPAIPYGSYTLLNDGQPMANKFIQLGDYYVAYGVAASDYYTIMDANDNEWGIASDWVNPATWYKMGAVDYSTYLPMSIYPEEMPMTLYLKATDDGLWVCAVEWQTLPELPQDEPTTTTYLKPNADWNTAGAWFAAYYYNNDSDYVWVKAVDTDSDGTYECSVNGTYTNVTFCRMNPDYDTMEWGTSEENRIWNKVEGLTVPTTEENCCYVSDWNAGEWNILNYTWSVKENCLYLKPSDNWKEANARFAAYFFGNGDTWVDMKRVGYEGYYEVEIPAGGYTSVIFCRFNPASTTNGWTSDKWGQTADLTIPTNGNNLYTIVGWAESGSAWSTLE